MALRITGLLTLVAALVLLVVAVPADATSPGPINVSGQSTTNDAGTPNDPGDDYNDLTGSLIGQQYTTSGDFRYDPLTGTVIAWGTETFVGCLDRNRDRSCGAGDATGTIDLSFIYWAQLDPETFALISAGCIHPVTGGTDGFAGAQGVLVMKDKAKNDGRVITTYTGKLSLLPQAAPTASRGATAVPAARPLSALGHGLNC
jgi:hypothetical protein